MVILKLSQDVQHAAKQPDYMSTRTGSLCRVCPFLCGVFPAPLSFLCAVFQLNQCSVYVESLKPELIAG